MTTVALKLLTASGLPPNLTDPKVTVVAKIGDSEIRTPHGEASVSNGTVQLDFLIRGPLSSSVDVSLLNGFSGTEIASGTITKIVPGPQTLELAPSGLLEVVLDLAPVACGTASVQRIPSLNVHHYTPPSPIQHSANRSQQQGQQQQGSNMVNGSQQYTHSQGQKQQQMGNGNNQMNNQLNSSNRDYVDSTAHQQSYSYINSSPTLHPTASPVHTTATARQTAAYTQGTTFQSSPSYHNPAYSSVYPSASGGFATGGMQSSTLLGPTSSPMSQLTPTNGSYGFGASSFARSSSPNPVYGSSMPVNGGYGYQQTTYGAPNSPHGGQYRTSVGGSVYPAGAQSGTVYSPGGSVMTISQPQGSSSMMTGTQPISPANSVMAPAMAAAGSLMPQQLMPKTLQQQIQHHQMQLQHVRSATATAAPASARLPNRSVSPGGWATSNPVGGSSYRYVATGESRLGEGGPRSSSNAPVVSIGTPATKALVIEEEDDSPLPSDRAVAAAPSTSRSAMDFPPGPEPASSFLTQSARSAGGFEKTVVSALQRNSVGACTEHVRTISGPATTTEIRTPVEVFWPTINPLVDMLRLIEVMDPVPAHNFKSLVFTLALDSTPAALTVTVGNSWSVKKDTTLRVSGLVVFKAPFDINGRLKCVSMDSADSFEIPLKQLVLSGVVCCQGRYQLSDTEYIKFRVALCEAVVPAPMVIPSATGVDIIPISVRDGVHGGGNSSPGGELAALSHKREMSADGTKKLALRTNRHLFNSDGTPVYNKLIVSVIKLEGFAQWENVDSLFIRACLGSVKAFRCRLDNWRAGPHNDIEFVFDYRGNKTMKFTLLTANEQKTVLGATQMNLGALLTLSKTSFHGSLPVNDPQTGDVCGRMTVAVTFSHSPPVGPMPPFKALSWLQAFTGGKMIRVDLKTLVGPFDKVHDPLFFRLSCGTVKIKSAKFSLHHNRNTQVLDLANESLELPIDQPLLSAAEQKDFILCVYSRYNSDTGCHTASHYVRLACGNFVVPSVVPRVVDFQEAAMNAASPEFSSEEFLLSYSLGVY